MRRRRRRLRENAFDWSTASFDELIEYANDYIDDFTDRERMEEYVIDAMHRNEYFLAIHILEALNDSDADFFGYDYSMGTLENPTPLETEQDLRDFISDYID